MSAIAIILAAAQPLAAKDVVTVPGRMIAIDGGRNFRDIGGYRTADGHWIRWATLYRSGSLGSLTPSGMVQLQHLNVRAIIDLRMT
jgi:protein-tyrosine phosphatase